MKAACRNLASIERQTSMGNQGIIMLTIGVLIVTRTFQYFPGMNWLLEVGVATCTVYLGVVMLRFPSSIGWNWPFEIYVALLMVVMPIWSGIMALTVNNQPIWFGILGFRGCWLLTFGLAVLYSIRSRLFSIVDVDRALVVSAWITVVVYTAMLVFLNPSDFTRYGNGFIEDRHIDGLRFKLNTSLPIYGLFHYLVIGWRERRFRWYLLSLFFWLLIFRDAGGRTVTICSFIAILVVSFHWGGLKRLFFGVVGLSFVLFIVIGISWLADPEIMIDRLNKFSDAIAVVTLDSDLIDDSSAASRVNQIFIALPLVEENFWFGMGRVSHQWIKDGYMALFGKYFFPDDIGILGMILQFGLLGVAFFARQFVFAWIYATRVRQAHPTIATDTAELYLVYIFFFSSIWNICDVF